METKNEVNWWFLWRALWCQHTSIEISKKQIISKRFKKKKEDLHRTFRKQSWRVDTGDVKTLSNYSKPKQLHKLLCKNSLYGIYLKINLFLDQRVPYELLKSLIKLKTISLLSVVENTWPRIRCSIIKKDRIV